MGVVGEHVGSTMSELDITTPEYCHMGLTSGDIATWQKTESLTRDFLGLTSDQEVDHNGVDANVNVRNMLKYTGGIEMSDFGTSASEAWGNC